MLNIVLNLTIQSDWNLATLRALFNIATQFSAWTFLIIELCDFMVDSYVAIPVQWGILCKHCVLGTDSVVSGTIPHWPAVSSQNFTILSKVYWYGSVSSRLASAKLCLSSPYLYEQKCCVFTYHSHYLKAGCRKTMVGSTPHSTWPFKTYSYSGLSLHENVDPCIRVHLVHCIWIDWPHWR